MFFLYWEFHHLILDLDPVLLYVYSLQLYFITTVVNQSRDTEDMEGEAAFRFGTRHMSPDIHVLLILRLRHREKLKIGDPECPEFSCLKS